MSLADLRDMLAGIADAGGLASGDVAVHPPPTDSDYHVFVFVVSAEEATMVKDLCFASGAQGGSNANERESWKELMRRPPCTSQDCLVVALTDWDGEAWLGLSTFLALAVSSSTPSHPDSPARDPCGSCLQVGRIVTNWRKYFHSLFSCLSGEQKREAAAASVAVSLDSAGTGEIACASLQSVIAVRRVSTGGRQLLSWCSSRLAKEWATARRKREGLVEEVARLHAALAQANARLERGQQPQDPGMGMGPLSLSLDEGPQSSASGAGAAPATAVSGRKRPASLINPQSRSVTKRAKGLRLP